MVWKKLKSQLDFKSPEAIEKQQLALLKKQLGYVGKHSPYYQKLFAARGFDGENLKKTQDVAQLPTTSKNDLSEKNTEFFAVDNAEIAEFVATSGTTGKPIHVALTRQDLKRLAYNEARSLQIAGIGPTDVVSITATLDKKFMAGAAYYSGLQKLGATAIRMGSGNPEFQWDTLKSYKATAIIGVPSFLHIMAKYGREHNMLHFVQKAICIGEPISEADFKPNILAEQIVENWPITLFTTYASTEIATAFTACKAHKGGHLLPELAILEILDDNEIPLPDGQLGEITLTPLGITGTPLVRYKTGDLARKYSSKCACGRYTPRIGPIEGRKSLMIKLKGTTIFPQQIENILRKHDVETFVIILEKDANQMDAVRIMVPKDIAKKTLQQMEASFETHLRVKPILQLETIATIYTMLLANGSRKPIKVQDKRNA